MYEKYKSEINLAKSKLSTIGFILEQDDDYKAIFGNSTNWKIDLIGKWYDEYCYISIRNISTNNIDKDLSFPIWMIMKFFGLNPHKNNTEEKLDFILKYKDKIFSDNFEYKKIYAKFKNINYEK